MLDCIVIGGGPSGLAAALVLARSRKQVALFDGGTPRNATAAYIGGFVTYDRVPPAQFRHMAHADLRAYPTVELHLDTLVSRVDRAGPKFRVIAGGRDYETRRVLLATGIIDEPFPVEGSRDLWGATLFQCPYCHAYEHRDQRFAFLAPAESEIDFAIVLRSWTNNVMLFTNGAFQVPADMRAKLAEVSIPIEERRIVGLQRTGKQLQGIAVEGGAVIPRDVMFFRPAQRQTPVVAGLALALDESGYVKVDDNYRTSIPGIHAAGDLMTHYHGALAAAAAGSAAAHCINRELTLELVGQGLL